MEKSKNNIIIIDGYGFIFRAFFSLQDFKTSTNMPIGAVYGFVNMILKILNTFSPSHIILIFDSGQKSFRSEIYPEYKAHRKEVPDDLKPQFEIVRDAVRALNIKYAEVNGFEADDLIATYSKICKNKGFKSIVISSDKDLMQLAQDGVVEFYDPLKGKFIKESDIRAKFGVEPYQIVDYLSIVGDASDNIPGVAGIGEKGAMELLNQYKTLEEIYENLNNIEKPKLKNALEKSKENAFLSKKLATLKFDISVEDISHFEVKSFNQDVLYDFLSKYELRSLIAKLLPNYGIKQASLFDFEGHVIVKEEMIIKTEASFRDFLDNIKEDEVLLKTQHDNLIIETNSRSGKIKGWWAE